MPPGRYNITTGEDVAHALKRVEDYVATLATETPTESTRSATTG